MNMFKNKIVVLIPLLLLTSCDGYICKSRDNYKPSNFVSFFQNKEVLTDKIAYIYKPTGNPYPLAKGNGYSADFKLVDSNKIIGVIGNYRCDYFTTTGYCTLTIGNSTTSMRFDSNLSVNDLALKCFEKLEITPTFSSNDMLLAIGNYFLKKRSLVLCSLPLLP